MNQEELNQEVLECARYGEDEDLRLILENKGNVDFRDWNGNTAMHRAAANGHVECLKILKEYNASYVSNNEGNTPCHWAAQNAQLEALKVLVEGYPNDVDVLAKNKSGRSVLTEAFSSNNRDVIEVCLSHNSSSEERLLAGMQATSTMDTENGEITTVATEAEAINEVVDIENSSVKDSVTHAMIFGAKRTLLVRELPITRADNPFGSDEAPEDDTTGLGIWPASILLSRWIVQLGPNYFKDKVVVELGAGCGLPSLATAVYCGAKSVYVTDIHEPTLQNAIYNLKLNGSIVNDYSDPKSMAEVRIQSGDVDEEGFTLAKVLNVNWKEPSTFACEKADILLGSDLVYDVKILDLLIPAIRDMLKPDGSMLYVAPTSGRDGMDELISRLEDLGLQCVEQYPVPPEMYCNPLADNDDDAFVLHFYDLSAHQPHIFYRFAFSQ